MPSHPSVPRKFHAKRLHLETLDFDKEIFVDSSLVSGLPSTCCSESMYKSGCLSSSERYQFGEPTQIVSKLGVNTDPPSQSDCGSDESCPSAATVAPCPVVS